jgi:hypothetical protein
VTAPPLTSAPALALLAFDVEVCALASASDHLARRWADLSPDVRGKYAEDVRAIADSAARLAALLAGDVALVRARAERKAVESELPF